MASNGPSASSSAVGSSDVVRDSFIPLFDGKPSSYREYRQRLVLYHKKMKLNKKPVEATINLLTSLTGNAWRQVQHLSESATESEEGFQTVLEALDKAFKYDDRVEMPRALDKFFYGLVRRPDQTLLSYCSDHREALRDIQKHGITLPAEVEGWILLRRSGLSQEQRQLIQAQVQDKFTPERIEETMYFLFGQDYRTTARPQTRTWFRSGAKTAPSSGGWRRYGAAHAAEDDQDWPDDWDQDLDSGYTIHEEQYDQSVEQEEDFQDWTLDDQLDEEALFQEEPGDEDTEEVEEAYATYLDARKRLAEAKLSRGFYPVVALAPGSDGPTPSPSQFPLATPANKGAKAKGKGPVGKGSKGKNKGSGKSHGKAAARAKATTCLRCGQPGHWAAQCPTANTNASSGPVKRPRESAHMASHLDLLPNSSLDFAVPQLLDSSILTAQQDGGASAFLGGHRPIMSAINHLLQRGVPSQRIKFCRANRRFMFGGDNSLTADWAVQLPVFIQGIPGRIQAFIVEGDTPLLIGRPVLKALSR